MIKIYFGFEDKSKKEPEIQKYAEEFDFSVVIKFSEMLHQLADNPDIFYGTTTVMSVIADWHGVDVDETAKRLIKGISKCSAILKSEDKEYDLLRSGGLSTTERDDVLERMKEEDYVELVYEFPTLTVEDEDEDLEKARALFVRGVLKLN